MNFSIIDFLIGLTLVNALPHFALGVWKGRMLSAFGFGDKQNIAYGFLNTAISLGLFAYKYGFAAILENEMYLGGLFVVVAYYVVGPTLNRIWHREYYAKKGGK
jgi:hypothetical protein